MNPTARSAALATLCLVTACGAPSTQPGTDDHRPPALASDAGPHPTLSEGADRAAVEQVYRRFWVVSSTFEQDHPDSQWKHMLGQVAAEPQLSLTIEAARLQRRNGITVYGQPVAHPTVLPINGADTATVRDCQDASSTGQADTTGHPTTVGIPRNPVVATVTRTSHGWRVSRIHFPGGDC